MGCRGVSYCNTLIVLKAKRKYRKEGGHKPKPSIKEKTEKRKIKA
jgi:hypothetical protein